MQENLNGLPEVAVAGARLGPRKLAEREKDDRRSAPDPLAHLVLLSAAMSGSA